MNRRTLLQLLSSVALWPAALPAWAQAGGGEPLPLGLNLAGFAYWSTEHPFSNLALGAANWRLQKDGASFTWDDPLPPMTADGYPTVVPKGTTIESFLMFTPRRAHLPVQMSLLYDGKGRIGYLSGAELETRSPGRDEVRNLRNGGPFSVRLLETDPKDPVRNIRLYPRDKQPEGTFRPEFLQRLGGMQALRFMDWMETNNSAVSSWDERPKKARFTQADGGVALEYMIELASTAKAAPWFTIPHLADDDYVTRCATLVKETLAPELPVYVEYSNEVWNGQFKQAEYARQRGLALGLSGNDFEAQLRFYAQRSSEVIAIWKKVFADQAERVRGVLAAQYANDWTSDTVLSWKDAAAGAYALAIAPYFGVSLGSPEQANEISGWSLDRLFEALGSEIDGENRTFVEKQAALAKRYGVKLIAYEGGQHLVGHAGAENNDKLTGLFQAANRDPRMGGLYLQHLAHWQASGGGLYVLFNSMGEYTKWGSWGLLEAEGVPNAKWDAVQSLLANAGKPSGTK